MSWGSLLEASWAGQRLWVESTDVEWQRRLVSHDYPGRDGAEHEDLGRAATDVRFQAFLFGDTYLTELRALQGLFAAGEAGTLIHPVLGSMTARLVTCREVYRHEKGSFVQLDLSFKEDQLDAVAFEVTTNTSSTAANAVSAAAAAAATTVGAL